MAKITQKLPGLSVRLVQNATINATIRAGSNSTFNVARPKIVVKRVRSAITKV